MAVATTGAIIAFGSRPITTAVPAAMALGLVLGRYSRGRDPDQLADQLDETRRQLEALALRDPLTGVLNHRAFQDQLEVELRRARRENWSVTVVAIDVDGFRELNDSRGHAYGDAALTAVAEGLSSDLRPGDLCGRIGGDEFMLALTSCDAATAHEVVDRLRVSVEQRAAAADVGALTLSAGIAEFPRHAIGRADLMRFADGAMYWSRSGGPGRTSVYSATEDSALSAEEEAARLRRSGMFNTVHALARAVDARDGYTHMHSQRVGFYAATLAAAMGLSDDRVEAIRMAGLLHDVGKIGIRDAILLKPGPLTKQEFAVMRRHAELGRAIIAGAGMPDIADWVGQLHERIDGRGYPNGLEGSEIPVESRLLHIADALEAMTCPRAYRTPKNSDEAVTELEAHAGTQFDEQAVRVMARLIREGAIEVGEQPRLGSPLVGEESPTVPTA
ncbi:MAG TPA: diguanylate cyclase [Thermoleophilaceae bacterium]|nr:diguanylate cyclase [Thermoleophilaceae bacterium]